MSSREILAKTVFAEARGECREGQVWVAWVIKNRAARNLPHWGGSTIEGVCRQDKQFECWNDRSDIAIPPNEQGVYEKILQLTNEIFDAPMSQDPTGGADHYNNPDKESPAWAKSDKMKKIRKIGNHQFYKEM